MRVETFCCKVRRTPAGHFGSEGCGSTQQRSMGLWAVVLITWPLVAALSSDRAKWNEVARDQAEKRLLDFKSSSSQPKLSEDWEADLLNDGDSDGGAWEAQTDYDNAQKQQRELKEEAQRFLNASLAAQKEYEDAQKKELKLREKMVKAFSLANQQKSAIAALETKKTLQEEALNWVKEDIKYGQREVQKYEEGIREVEAEIGKLKRRIRNITTA